MLSVNLMIEERPFPFYVFFTLNTKEPHDKFLKFLNEFIAYLWMVTGLNEHMKQGDGL